MKKEKKSLNLSQLVFNMYSVKEKVTIKDVLEGFPARKTIN